MSLSEVSKRYAKALYHSAKETSSADRVLAELRIVNEAIQSDKGIQDFLSRPTISADQKVAALSQALNGKVAPTLMSALKLLADKNRLSIFSELSQAFEYIIDEDNGVTRGVVRSASPLTVEARKKIEETVNRVTGKSVILTFTVDPKILGGMIAQVAGWTFDDSLNSHLNRINEELNRRSH